MDEQLIHMLNQVPVLVWISAFVLLISLSVSRRSHGRIRRLQKELKQARSDLKALTTASVGVGGRVLELERRLARLSEKQQEMDIYESANQPYDHAIHLAKKGLQVDDIVEMCGISRNEAELIQMMNRFKEAG